MLHRSLISESDPYMYSSAGPSTRFYLDRTTAKDGKIQRKRGNNLNAQLFVNVLLALELFLNSKTAFHGLFFGAAAFGIQNLDATFKMRLPKKCGPARYI